MKASAVWLLGVAFLPALALAQAPAADLNTITSVQVNGGTVSITGSKKANFTTFTMTDPPRLVIDISEAVFSGVPEEQSVGNGTVTGIRTASYGSDASAIARVLIGYEREVETDIQANGNQLVVKVTGGGGQAAAPEPLATAQTQATPESQPAGQSAADAAKAAAADRAAQEKAAADAAAAARAEREAQEKAAAEAAARAQADAEAERKRQAEATAQANADAERKRQEEATAQANAEAERKRQQEAQAAAQANAEAERKRQQEEARAAAQAAADEKRAAAQAAADEKRAAAQAAADERKAAAQAAADEKKAAADERKAAAQAAADEKKAAAQAAADERKRQQEEARAERERRQQAVASAETTRARPASRAAEEEPLRESASSGPVQVSSRRKTMTLVGFQQQRGASRVFVRTNEPARYTVSEGGRTVVLELENTRVELSNNTLPLDTQFFNGPVARVEADPGPGRTVRVTIQLKQAAPFQTRQDGNVIALDFRR